jgi:hypothetical protein
MRSVGGRVVMNKSIIKPTAKLTAYECDMTEEQLAELTQVLKLAKTAEPKGIGTRASNRQGDRVSPKMRSLHC